VAEIPVALPPVRQCRSVPCKSAAQVRSAHTTDRSVPTAGPRCTSSDAVHIRCLGAVLSSRFSPAQSAFTRSSGARYRREAARSLIGRRSRDGVASARPAKEQDIHSRVVLLEGSPVHPDTRPLPGHRPRYPNRGAGPLCGDGDAVAKATAGVISDAALRRGTSLFVLSSL
jgi:hypothetical protein